MRMCLQDIEILIFYTYFQPHFITHQYTNIKDPIWAKLSCFCDKLLKIHQIFVIWPPLYVMKTLSTHLLCIPNCVNKQLKGQVHIHMPRSPDPITSVLISKSSFNHYSHLIPWEEATLQCWITWKLHQYFNNDCSVVSIRQGNSLHCKATLNHIA